MGSFKVNTNPVADAVAEMVEGVIKSEGIDVQTLGVEDLSRADLSRAAKKALQGDLMIRRGASQYEVLKPGGSWSGGGVFIVNEGEDDDD